MSKWEELRTEAQKYLDELDGLDAELKRTERAYTYLIGRIENCNEKLLSVRARQLDLKSIKPSEEG